MLRIVVALCVVAATAAMGGKQLYEKYAYTKVMQSCIGEEAVVAYKMEMRAACEKCEGQDISETMMDIQKMLKQMRKKFSATSQVRQTPIYVPVPVYYNQLQQQQPQFQIPQLSQFRTKRDAHWDLSSEGVKKMKAKMMAKISNVTCVLKELNYMTADNQPNYDYFTNKINEMQVSVDLKEDFLEAMDMCRDFAMCLPTEKAKLPVKRELGTMMGFMKCMHMQKAKVCMAADFKKYAPMMGFEGDLTTQEGSNMADEIATMLTEGGDIDL